MSLDAAGRRFEPGPLNCEEKEDTGNNEAHPNQTIDCLRMSRYRLREPHLGVLNHQSNHNSRNNSAYRIEEEVRDDPERRHRSEEQEDKGNHEGEGAVGLSWTSDEDAI